MNSLRLSFFLKYFTAVILFISSVQFGSAQVDFTILNGDTQICAGDSVLLSIDATVDSVRWSPTTGVAMPEALSTNVAPTMSTTYFATLFFGDQTQVVPIQVDVFSEATLGEDVSVCSIGGTLMYDFSNLPLPGDYQMTNNGGFVIAETSNNIFIVEINNVVPGTYDLAVSNPACNQSDTIQVEIVAGAAALLDFQEEDRVICAGDMIDFSVPAVAGQTYEWTANGISVSSTTMLTDTPSTTTTYVISATGASCSLPTQDSVTITVNNDPAISLPEAIDACQNDIVQLGNNIAQAGTTYSWETLGNDPNTVVDPNAVNADLFVTEDVTYILTANNGCEIMDTIEVTMIPNNINLEDTIFVCLGDDVTIDFSTNPPNDNVVWTNLDGSPLLNVPSPFTVTPDDVVSYIATVENNGCTFTDTVTLQVDSLPMNLELMFSEYNNAPPPICVDDTVQIVSTLFDETFFPNIEYQWLAEGLINNGPESEFLTGDTLFNIYLNGQRTKIYSRIATNGACIDTLEIEVPVVPVLMVKVEPTGPFCPNTDIVLTGTAIDPETNMNVDAESEWEWMVTPGSVEPAEGQGENMPTVTLGASTTNGMVTVTYEGCPNMEPFDVQVLSTPEIAFPASLICPGDSIMLNNGFVGMDYTFQWESSNNDLGIQANDSNPVVFPSETTTYSVTVTNADCEPVMDQVTIEIFDQAEELNEIIEVTGCIGQTVTLSLPDDYVGGPGAVYTWTTTGMTPITTTELSIDVLVVGTANYDIQVQNDCGQDLNIGSAFVSVAGYEGDEIDLDLTACSFDNGITLSMPEGFNGGTDAVYTWVPNEEGFETLVFSDPDQTNFVSINQDVTYDVFVTNDCVQDFEIGEVMVSLTVIPEIVILIDTISGGTTLFEGDVLGLEIGAPGADVEYTWASENGGSFDQNPGISTMYTITGTNMDREFDSDIITVTASNNDCTIDASLTIAFEAARVFLPNIFTPGQNQNTIFRIRAPDNVEIIDLQIYDRWGNKVYDNDNVEQEWDGMINGQPGPSEVYIYTVTYQIPGQDPVTASRDLTLVR